MPQFVFVEVEPGVAFEYRTYWLAGGRGLGLVRKEESRSQPYESTGRWVAALGEIVREGFETRLAAAEFLLSLVPKAERV